MTETQLVAFFDRVIAESVDRAIAMTETAITNAAKGLNLVTDEDQELISAATRAGVISTIAVLSEQGALKQYGF